MPIPTSSRAAQGSCHDDQAKFGVHLAADLHVFVQHMLWEKGAVLCSIFPAREAEICEANQREVKEMWEPYSWGSLTTIKTNIKRQRGSPPSWPWKPSGQGKFGFKSGERTFQYSEIVVFKLLHQSPSKLEHLPLNPCQKVRALQVVLQVMIDRGIHTLLSISQKCLGSSVTLLTCSESHDLVYSDQAEFPSLPHPCAPSIGHSQQGHKYPPQPEEDWLQCGLTSPSLS